MKKLVLLTNLILSILFVSDVAFAAYPTHPINGIIQWGAGGALDSSCRAITPLVEKALKQTIILQNKPGASGAVAFNQVYTQKGDGYNIFYGAESPVLYKVSGLAKNDYDEMEPICIFMQCLAIFLVPENSPYKTYQDVIDAVKTGTNMKIGSTGPGGTPYMINALMSQVHGVKIGMINFDGEGPAISALMGGHIDAIPVTVMSAAPFIKSGKVKALAVYADKRFNLFPDVPAVTEMYDDYNKWLPWSVFFGAFVKKGTPKDIINTLSKAYTEAAQSQQYKDFAASMGGIATCLSNTEARDFLNKSRSTASWLMYRSGSAKNSPANYGIPEPK